MSAIFKNSFPGLRANEIVKLEVASLPRKATWELVLGGGAAGLRRGARVKMKAQTINRNVLYLQH